MLALEDVKGLLPDVTTGVSVAGDCGGHGRADG